MNVIKDLRQHPKAASLFKAHLLQNLHKEVVAKLLTARDKIIYGELIDFMHSYGASIILTNDSVYITVSKEHAARFATVEHGSITYMYYRKCKGNTTFEYKFNHAIVEFFTQLDESIF